MEIYKGSLLKLKGTLQNGLYVHQGSIEIEYVDNVTNLSAQQTILWHKRLAQISERGILELSKHGPFGVE